MLLCYIDTVPFKCKQRHSELNFRETTTALRLINLAHANLLVFFPVASLKEEKNFEVKGQGRKKRDLAVVGKRR